MLDFKKLTECFSKPVSNRVVIHKYGLQSLCFLSTWPLSSVAPALQFLCLSPQIHSHELSRNSRLGHLELELSSSPSPLTFKAVPYTSKSFIITAYQFPITALENYHRFCYLKKHKLIILEFCRIEVKQSHWTLGGSVQKSFPCLVQFPEASCIPCFVVPSSIFQTSGGRDLHCIGQCIALNSVSIITSSSLTLFSLPLPLFIILGPPGQSRVTSLF